MPNLADGGLDDILNQIATDLVNGQYQDGQIHPDLYKLNADKLLTAVMNGLGGSQFAYNDSRNSLAAYLQQNVHAFSAAKSMYEMRHFASLKVREDGTLRSHTAFRNKLLSAGYQFNKTFLETEDITTEASAQMAANWHHLQGSEFIEYNTVGDSRVRPEHAALDGFTAKPSDPIWNTIYPPCAWRCGCTAIPGVAANVGRVTINSHVPGWQDAYKITPYFRRNVGITKAVFDLNGPVYKIGNKKDRQLLAIDHYGMQPVSKILEINDFSPAPGFATRAEAHTWWQGETEGNGYKDFADPKGLTVRVDDEAVKHIIDDHLRESRQQYIKALPEILTAPDEMWSTRLNNKLERVYLKYYEGQPIVVRVNGETMRPYTMHSLLKPDGKLHTDQVIQLRKGALLFRK